MRIVRTGCSALAVTVALIAVASLLHRARLKAQTTVTTISSSSGAVEWDHGAVVAGQVTNLGVQDICPPGLCDNHDLRGPSRRAGCCCRSAIWAPAAHDP
jgi:hypothetical protein